MKKTKNIGKIIVSVILAMSILLSFALVSVSAVPGEYPVVENKVKKYQFNADEDISEFQIIAAGSREISEEMAYGDTGSSLKIIKGSETADGVTVGYTPKFGFEANSMYYISFDFYSEQWNALDNQCFSTHSTLPSGTKTMSFSSNAGSASWRKAIIKIHTGDEPQQTFRFGMRGGSFITAATHAFIDNFECAKVSTLEAPVNDVPDGVTAQWTYKFDIESSLATFSYPSGQTAGVATSDMAHWGEKSFAFTPVSNDFSRIDGASSFYMNTYAAGFDYSKPLEAGGMYYMSFYAYSPVEGANITVNVNYEDTAPFTFVPTQEIPKGVWTKYSGFVTFPVKPTTNQLKWHVTNAAGKTVYFDDFLVAKISSVEDISLTLNDDVELDGAAGTAIATYTSNFDIVSADITAPDGVGATVTVDDDGVLVVALSGVKGNATYNLTASVVDVFGRTTEVPLTIKTPVTLEEFSNDVPKGATAQWTYKFDIESSLATFSYPSGQTEGVATSDVVHWGEKSFAFTPVSDDYSRIDGASSFYMNTYGAGFGYSKPLEAGGMYYISFYVYSPVEGANLTLNVNYEDTAPFTFISTREIPKGVWTKYSGVATFPVKPTTNQLKWHVTNAAGKTVYFDDFLVAKLSSVDEFAIESNNDVKVNNGTVTATYTSTVDLASAEITAPEGVTATATPGVNGALVVSLSGVESNTTYDLTAAIVDVFGRTAEVPLTIKTPEILIEGISIVTTGNQVKVSTDTDLTMAQLIFVSYDTNGKMVDMDFVDVTLKAQESQSYTPVDLAAGASAKVMLWENLTNCKPLATAIAY